MSDYQERLGRVLAYIHQHLDEPLDLNKLAEVACLSPYHWHRIYASVLGETAAATVRRLRLHRATAELIGTHRTIEQIALTSGFNSVQAFARVFRSSFGISPGEYRSEKEKTKTMFQVEIRELPAATAIIRHHRGSYMKIGIEFEQLCGWLASKGLAGPRTRLVGLYYDDPSIVPEPELRSAAGAILPQQIELEAPYEKADIPAGKYAVLRFKGPYAELHRAWEWLYGQWLPQSGYEPANAPGFEEYVNSPSATPPADLLTDICLPLR